MRNLIVAAALALTNATSLAADTQPYAGQDERPIASLSAQDIQALQAGQGWGFAKSAELNGYPGPAHVLELADTLGLSADQRNAVQAIWDTMNAAARETGAAFVQAEAQLDAAFADQTATPQTVQRLAAEAGALRAALRAIHLNAHLEVTPLLSRHQQMLYAQARGYGSADHGDGHSGH